MSTSKNAREIESLNRATQGNSLTNYPAIYQGFINKGISENDIKPRQNVFTYPAWRAQGRQVRRGEKGVRVVTIIESEEKVVNKKTGKEEVKISQFPRRTTVFHISQTE
ncbi:MAG TPA: ArdC-like ssDNA-binding domain-containing protein [Candidatus Bathyarchaeia archaeon]|nr:ArdC-like ssDNA-binding domain-containing protein [Candidatus Bathyarchaeia archaeon]